MAAAGAIGFKAFLSGPPPERAEEFRGLVASSPAQLLASMAVVSETGLPFAIHCEDASLVEAGVAAARAAQHTGLRAHTDSRPPIAEVVATAVALEVAAAVGVRLYLAHMSTGRALQLADDARGRGVSVVFETCPHYFLLDSETAEPLGPFAKVNPPLRDRREVAALWEGVVGGNVDVVGSDHAPYTVAEKERGWSDIFSAPSGSPGAETLGPALIDLALQNRLPWSRVVELLSGRAAEIFGLSARKGQLAPGLDADCVVIDPQQTWAVERAGFMTRSRDSARIFEGRRLRGRITRVYLRGKPVFADNRVQQAAGYGHFVKPVVT
jgi:dihydropyrimidinase/allantoinase